MHYDNFDMGRAEANGYNEGYRSGAIDALEYLADRLEDYSDYNKNETLSLIKKTKEEYKNIKI